MADNIRGLKVEIAADATKFNAEMKKVRAEAKSAKTDLNTLQKSLQLEYNDKKFAEAQKIAQQAIEKTAESANNLRSRLQYLEQNGNVNTAEYRKLQTELNKTELQAQQLQLQLEQLNKIKLDHIANQFTDMGGKIQSAGKAFAPFSAAAVGGITVLAATGKTAIKTGDDIATLATKYDMSAEALQRFNYVALQTDVNAEDLHKAFVKVRAGVADLATGTTSTASKALQQLNLDFESFDGSEEQFYAIINALSSMTDKTQMVAIANDVFGDKLANNILPLIYAGTDAVNQYRSEFDELGALTDEQVAQLGVFDNVLNKINVQIKNSITQIGASLLPIMQRIADMTSTKIVPQMQKLANWFNNLTLAQQEFALKALLVVAALAPLAMGIGKLVTSIGSVIKILPQLGSALTALEAHPIIAIIGLVAMLMLLLYNHCEAFREAINMIVETISTALQPVMDALMQVLNLIMAVLKPIIDIVGGVLAVAINVITSALQPVIEIIQTIFDIISPLLDMLISVVDMILTPINVAIQALFAILQPLLSVALIPLKVVLNALKVPLQMIGTLLGWLAPLFQVFGNVVTKIFGGVVKIINLVVGAIEDAVNFVIGIINGLIDGVNGALGWLGVHINRIAEVKLRIDTSDIEDMDDVNAIINSTPSAQPNNPTDTYDKIGVGGTNGDIYNNDYSTNNTTQNVTVTIQNYAAEVDTDALVKEINIKLAEAM